MSTRDTGELCPFRAGHSVTGFIALACMLALAELREAPMERLFEARAAAVSSRGELGEISALNQKLWLQARESERFLMAP
jgi:hypothetical protein